MSTSMIESAPGSSIGLAITAFCAIVILAVCGATALFHAILTPATAVKPSVVCVPVAVPRASAVTL